MTSSDLRRVNLARLIRSVAQTTVKQALAKQRTPSTLAGTVEQLDEDLDVAWVRMDAEAMSGDPAESLNYEYPGIIPTTRAGETNTDDQVRVLFDGPAGASATRTSTENVIVLPFGAESGRRIVLDGNTGEAKFYDDSDALVATLDTELWSIGDVGNLGARIQIDPVGGITIRSATNELVAILDQNGYSLRDGTTGQVTAEITKGHFHLLDPVNTDGIEMVTSSAGTLSNPAYRSAKEVSPGASLTAPAAPLFTTTPADDIEIAHVAAWKRATLQAATMTPPAGHTEQSDENFDHAQGTLQTSVATRDPATGTTGDFTSTQSNWDHGLGTRIVVRGGGATSPSFRSISYMETATAAATVVATISKPAGVVAGDVLVTFVSMGVNGGLIPTGWVTPDGFVFLGANFSTSGSGSTASTLATGCWIKLAGASEPATYSTTINLPTGTKLISAQMVAIQNPFLVPGGVQIRMAGKPIRRLLAYTELAAAGTTLCDFQNIPQGYDNLELVYDGTSASGAGATRLAMAFNGDATAANYFSQVTSDGGINQEFGTNARILLGALGVGVGAASVGEIKILGYARALGRHGVLGHAYWVTNVDLRDDSIVGQWGSGTSPITRIVVTSTGNNWQAGSRAYLYGY